MTVSLKLSSVCTVIPAQNFLNLAPGNQNKPGTETELIENKIKNYITIKNNRKFHP